MNFFKKFILFLSAANFISAPRTFAADNYDLLLQQAVAMKSTSADSALSKSTGNLKAVFLKYKINLAKGMSIARPLVIGGTQNQPQLTVTIEKCVLFFCKDVTLNLGFSLQEYKSTCDRTFVVTGDLSRSDEILTDVYSRLGIILCYRKQRQQNRLDLEMRAVKAPNYSTGYVQGEILKMVQLQSQSIQKAFINSLIENGAEQITPLN